MCAFSELNQISYFSFSYLFTFSPFLAPRRFCGLQNDEKGKHKREERERGLRVKIQSSASTLVRENAQKNIYKEVLENDIKIYNFELNEKWLERIYGFSFVRKILYGGKDFMLH